MAKYEVKFSCGHTHTVELFGKMAERERKIKYLEECGTCPECREKEKAVDCEEIEMNYAEYKNNYSDCKTKAGSYNAKTKTIVVYVPKKEEAEAETETEVEKDLETEAVEKIAEIAERELTEDYADKIKRGLSRTFEDIEKQYQKEIQKMSDERKEKTTKIFVVMKWYKEKIGEI